MKKLKVYVDGSCFPNPGGPAAYGFVVYSGSERISAQMGKVEEKKTTNNIAEYWSAIKALEYLLSIDFSGSVEIFSDSKLLVNQLNEDWRIKYMHLYELADKFWRLAENFERVRLTWIPREKNFEADLLSKSLVLK